MKTMIKQKTSLLLSAFLVALAALGVVAGILLTQRSTDNRSDAAGGATLKVLPEKAVKKVGDTGNFNVFLEYPLAEGELVSGFQLAIKYDSAVINLPEAITGSFGLDSNLFGDYFDNNGYDSVQNIYNKLHSIPNSTQKVFVVAFGLPFDQNPVPSPKPGTIVSFPYTVTGEGTTQIKLLNSTEANQLGITLDTSLSTPTGAVTVNTVPGEVTTQQPTTQTVGKLRLRQVTPSVYIGKTAEFVVEFNTAGVEVAGIDAVIKYPSTQLQVSQVRGDGVMTNYTRTQGVGNTGDIVISGDMGSGGVTTTADEWKKLGTVVITGTAATTQGYLNFDFTKGGLNDSNMAKRIDTPAEPVDILDTVTNVQFTITNAPASIAPTPTLAPTPTPTPTLAPTATPSTTGTIKVSLKVPYQGKRRTGVVVNMPVQLTWINNALPTAQPVVVHSVTDAEGNINGTFELDATIQNSQLVSNYTLRLDSPAYLQKEYKPTINAPLANPVASLVLTDPVLGGDLETSFSVNTNGTFNAVNRDGKVNSFDYARLVTKYGQFGNQVETVYYDMDNSTQINSLDFSIMRSNWLCEDAKACTTPITQ